MTLVFDRGTDLSPGLRTVLVAVGRLASVSVAGDHVSLVRRTSTPGAVAAERVTERSSSADTMVDLAGRAEVSYLRNVLYWAFEKASSGPES